MEVYKVVGKRNRYSSNLILYTDRDSCELKISDLEKRLNASWRKLFELFILKYRKGAIIKAAPGTSGIFCFASKTDAYRFINICSLGSTYKISERLTIIKVRGIGKPEYNPTIISCVGDNPSKLLLSLKDNQWYNYKEVNSKMTGVVCFPEVEVLE